MSHKVNYYDEHNPQMEISLSTGYRMSFSVASVKPESHDWLGGVLERQIEEQIHSAVHKALNEHKAMMRTLLGI